MRSLWRSFSRDKAAVAGLIILILMILMAVFGPLLLDTSPSEQVLRERRAPISQENIFGRDHLGRDIFARIVYGARLTILSGLFATGIAALVGFVIGLIAGYFGSWTEEFLMRTVDLALAFPYFLVAILIISILGPGLRNAIIAVGIAKTPIFARFVRGLTLQSREEGYTEAARAIGSGHGRIMFLHILPNIAIPTLVLATVEVASSILSVAGLSFLGLGAQPPTSEWGLMLSQARGYFSQAPHIMIIPGLFLSLLVLSINLVGDGMQLATDPRQRGA